VVIHVVQGEHQAAVEEAFDYAEGAEFEFMGLKIFSEYLAALLIVRANNRGEFANFEMFFDISFLDYFITMLIEAIDREFMD